MKTDCELSVGFIGLGAMGAPMAANLYKAGCLAAVWNRAPGRLDSFVETHPVRRAQSPADLAAGLDVVITCVSADADLLEVVEQLLPALGSQSVLVDCSTVGLETARAVAAQVQGRGAAFLDAPVSGGVEGARRGTLAMMVGGDRAALERVRPVLSCMAARIEYMGPSGSGQATKAVNQIMAAGINQAVTEALAFAQAHELPMDRVIEVVGGGAAANWFLDHRGRSMVEESFSEGFKVALHHKDLEICRGMAEALGVSLPVVKMTLVHYRRLMQAGFGEEDISALFREKLALFRRGARQAQGGNGSSD
jgi:3-hydroxyisobutyrate dehydrogenase